MHHYESSPGKRITFISNGGGYESFADIVEELPEIGDTFDCNDSFGPRTVLEIVPRPLSWMEQKTPEIWSYAIWYLHLQGNVYRYIAIHEEESEHL